MELNANVSMKVKYSGQAKSEEGVNAEGWQHLGSQWIPRQVQSESGVDMGVVELFAWLHDSCRLTDGRDLEHGPRAAAHARQLRGEFFELSDERFELLSQACESHTRGFTEASPTVPPEGK